MNFLVEPILVILLVLYPTLLLLVRDGTNVCFVLLLLMSVIELARNRKIILSGLLQPGVILYAIAMASLSVAVLLSEAYHKSFTLSSFDGPTRFLLAVPIFLFMRQFPSRILASVQYGFIGSGLAILAVAILRPPSSYPRLTNYYLDAIHFGDLALIVGVLALLSIHWDRKDSWGLIGLKVVAFLGAIGASIRSATRGAWVALPIVLLIWWLLAGKRFSRKMKILVTSGVVAAVIMLAAVSSVMHWHLNQEVYHRFAEGISDLTTLGRDKDSSIGARIQDWKTALYLFAQNPIFGIGPDQFQESARSLVASGYLTPYVARYNTGDVHSEVLSRAAAEGIFGIAAILLIYFVPFGLFVRACRSSDHAVSTAGVLGTSFVASFIVFGLTIEIFGLKTLATFYSLVVANLLAITKNCNGTDPGGDRIHKSRTSL
jgi:O-antigen ligase